MYRNDPESLNHLLPRCPVALTLLGKVFLGGYYEWAYSLSCYAQLSKLLSTLGKNDG
ncbi:hypothetical protein RchiOBHm_Chr6g0283111 [Rosa chinensis]|uniref:Uncharacterized protein n=1 Tax=Rosa chinensis TaxID=74649 RepID=A0A2P6PTX3_ROSCH|nr:hypothetical protein RchiOBHm_Chr6g0283111 [Rosa chinensis]